MTGYLMPVGPFMFLFFLIFLDILALIAVPKR